MRGREEKECSWSDAVGEEGRGEGIKVGGGKKERRREGGGSFPDASEDKKVVWNERRRKDNGNERDVVAVGKCKRCLSQANVAFLHLYMYECLRESCFLFFI